MPSSRPHCAWARTLAKRAMGSAMPPPPSTTTEHGSPVANGEPWGTDSPIPRSSSREARIRVPTFFSAVHFSRGTFPRKKVAGHTGGPRFPLSSLPRENGLPDMEFQGHHPVHFSGGEDGERPRRRAHRVAWMFNPLKWAMTMGKRKPTPGNLQRMMMLYSRALNIVVALT